MWIEVVVAVVAVLVAALISFRAWYRSTAGQCRSTKSMEGKTVIITGATAGIGKETAQDMLRRGARVILACRNLEKACRVAGELSAGAGGAGEVVVRRLDTSNFASVRSFAKEVLDTEKAIHVLINNAGILDSEERRETPDGLELTMATNHYGHFLLTNLLLGRLKESAPSRVVNVSSLAHEFVKEEELEDLNVKKNYRPWKAYGLSKMCNVLFSRELSDKMAGTGVTSNSLHPGVVQTDIFNTKKSLMDFTNILLWTGKNAESGAQTTIHVAVCEEVEGVTGRYFSDCKEKPASEVGRRKDLAVALWEASVKAVKLEPEEIHY